jgi:hypothetical protein
MILSNGPQSFRRASSKAPSFRRFAEYDEMLEDALRLADVSGDEDE